MRITSDSAAAETTSVSALVAGNTQFTLDLYQRLRKTPGNLFFSPYSISTVLALTYAGARNDTASQMKRCLHFPEQGDVHEAFRDLDTALHEAAAKRHIALRVANALWPQAKYELLEQFLALAREYYAVELTPLDYSKPKKARQHINSWVEDKTERKIKDLIGPGALDELTRLVLTNAIYFKGTWLEQFEPRETEKEPFWITDSERIRTPLMRQTNKFGYAENDELQVLQLPYAGGELAMFVLLPRKRQGLADVERALTVTQLNRWTADLRQREVDVLLPRFRMDLRCRLGVALESLGMVNAFDRGVADFSGMDGRKGWLYVDEVIHQAFVNVNEEGTEAAAATAVVMMRSLAMPSPTPTFRADHPFLFLIRDERTESILFLGRVVRPED
jgi:serpin B